MPERRIVLASGSAVRAALLRGAGLEIDVIPSSVDEDAIKRANGNADIEMVALTLARAKAEEVSAARPDDLVIGADQILECDGARFDKPKSRDEAAAHLRALRGRTHHLITASSIYRAREEIWSQVSIPRLAVRNFSEEFIAEYLDRAGDDVLTSVGAYKLEGLGANLFDSIDGDYFAILGLPLLPLLAFLRAEGLLRA